MAYLGDYISIKHGYAFKGEHITTKDNGVVLVTPGNFAVGGGFKENKCKFFDGEYPQEYVLSAGDLIVTMTDLSKDGDTLGFSALVPKSNRIYLHNQRIGLVKINNKDADKRYIYWFMRTPAYQKSIVASASGSTVKHTSPSRICEIPITLPSLTLQRKISDFLSNIDDKIALNTAINKNLEEQARAIFKRRISNCCSFTTIGNLSENVLDYTPNPNTMVKLLNSSDVTEGVFPNVNYVLNENLKGHFKKRFKYGDILYSEIRPRNHHYGYVLFDADDYIASTRLMIIRAVPNAVYPALLYQYLLLPKVESEFVLKTESRSGTFPQGNYADMASIEVPFIPFSEQGEIADVLSQIRNLIAKKQQENELLAELRDALLPKLMSGEIDVSAAGF